MDKKVRLPLEVHDVRIVGCDISGDGEAWTEIRESDFSASGGGLPHLLDLLSNGERVLCRTRYVEIYKNGRGGLPKTGPIYELKIVELQPMRQLINLDAKQLEAGITPTGTNLESSDAR